MLPLEAIPTVSPEELTKFIQKEYGRLEGIRKRIKNHRSLSPELCDWLERLSRAACENPPLAERMSADELLAAIFLVNRGFKRGQPGAKEVKNKLQTFLWERYGPELGSVLKEGKYKIRKGAWCIHIPQRLVRRRCRGGA